MQGFIPCKLNLNYALHEKGRCLHENQGIA
jgi:hypothetical protein